MNKDNHWLLNVVGCLLVVAFSVLVFPTMVTVALAADEKSVGPAKALDGIPKDLSIVYGTGATHAEWGRTTYRISADGKVSYEKTRGSRSTGSRQQEDYRLTREELQSIIAVIQDNGFFSLDNHYSNPKVHDGWSSYISVSMGNTSHTVAVMNIRQKEFAEIAGFITQIVDKKRTTKPN